MTSVRGHARSILLIASSGQKHTPVLRTPCIYIPGRRAELLGSELRLRSSLPRPRGIPFLPS
jgi:hypothetical protein